MSLVQDSNAWDQRCQKELFYAQKQFKAQDGFKSLEQLKNQRTYLDKSYQDSSHPVQFISHFSPQNNKVPSEKLYFKPKTGDISEISKKKARLLFEQGNWYNPIGTPKLDDHDYLQGYSTYQKNLQKQGKTFDSTFTNKNLQVDGWNDVNQDQSQKQSRIFSLSKARLGQSKLNDGLQQLNPQSNLSYIINNSPMKTGNFEMIKQNRREKINYQFPIKQSSDRISSHRHQRSQRVAPSTYQRLFKSHLETVTNPYQVNVFEKAAIQSIQNYNFQDTQILKEKALTQVKNELSKFKNI